MIGFQTSGSCEASAQGSVLGPAFFLMYGNDLDCWLICKISKFADDSKLGSTSHSKEKCEIVQRNLDILSEWSDKWLLKFTSCKCKVMYIGNDNKI